MALQKYFSRLFIFLSALLMIACAKPQWQTTYQYVPPQSKDGLQCVTHCQQQLNQCRNSCENAYQQCLIRAEKTARDNFPVTQQQYAQALANYQIEAAQYEARRAEKNYERQNIENDKIRYEERCRNNPQDKTACELADKSRRALRHFFIPDGPQRPGQPDLSTNIALAQASCTRSCNCIETHNTCYAGCGGNVNAIPRCIANCPDGVPQLPPVTY